MLSFSSIPHLAGFLRYSYLYGIYLVHTLAHFLHSRESIHEAFVRQTSYRKVACKARVSSMATSITCSPFLLNHLRKMKGYVSPLHNPLGALWRKLRLLRGVLVADGDQLFCVVELPERALVRIAQAPQLDLGRWQALQQRFFAFTL